MELIDKDAVVAEIERLYYKHTSKEYTDEAGCVLEKLEDFIDNLEVKEVDLDSDIRTYLTNNFNIYEDGVLQSKKSGLPISTYDIIKVAKHFFELGIQVNNKAQKVEEV